MGTVERLLTGRYETIGRDFVIGPIRFGRPTSACVTRVLEDT